LKYKYSVSEEGNRKYVEVEQAGRFELAEGDNAKDKAKAVLVSTQPHLDENDIELEKVDNVQSGVITSEKPAKKR
jgi:hypothetical protein